MKNIYLLVLTIISISFAQAQTTLEYTGTGLNYQQGQSLKTGGIGLSTATSPTSTYNCGLLGEATNNTYNVGIWGTTKQNRSVTNIEYVAILGENSANNLQTTGAVRGGKFLASNSSTIGATVGVEALAYGSGTGGNFTTGVAAYATNNSNTFNRSIYGVKAQSQTGVSTLNLFYDITNPGGYFESNSGQGLYAESTGYYNFQNANNKISQAITGYSSSSGANMNIGVLGVVNPSGTTTNNYGVYGRLYGAFSPGSSINAAVYGVDDFNVNNSYAGYFSGKVYATGTITQSSDQRLKKELAVLSNSLSGISNITGYHYKWIDPSRGQDLQTGLMAQEVQKIFPELVQIDGNRMLSVNYIGLIPHLIEAMKELKKENETLKNSKQSLEERIGRIEQLLSSSSISVAK
jgi:hypothetical protein